MPTSPSCTRGRNSPVNQQNLADFIWNVADALRGDFKQSEYGRIILPFTVLRRLECVLELRSTSYILSLFSFRIYCFL